MRSGDGLLVRVKPHGGVLELAQAEGLASLAQAHGNGQIDLTGRANLQLRGVSDATLEPLLQGLARLGLLDPDPEAEAVRNIVASPLAGRDPGAAADIRPVVAALEERLATDPNCRRLPTKWSIVVDDGGALALNDVAADLRLRFADAETCLVGLGGVWAVAGRGEIGAMLSRLAVFVAARRPARMRDLVQEAGADALLAAAGLSPTDRRPAERLGVAAGGLLGHHRDHRFVGVAPPFGSLPACDLARLVALARCAGAHDLRLTPWRCLLVTFDTSAALRSDDPAWIATPAAPPRNCEAACGAGETDGQGGAPDHFLHHAAAAGLIIDGDDPRLRLVACTGAPGCHRATATTRADAARLSSALPGGTAIQFHISGCDKGCARPGATPWTFVGRGGRYDLVRDGVAGDTPVARGLSFAEAAAWVRGAMQGATA